MEGVHSEELVSRMRAGGHRDARLITNADDVQPVIKAEAEAGDYVIYLGAGNITQWAYALPEQLKGGA